MSYPYEMARLTSDELDQALAGLAGWERDGDAIRRRFSFPGFPEAIGYVVRVAFAAEAADHHPDLLVEYKRVTVRYWTHTDGGVTAKDVEGARAADALASAAGGR
jgi:4a-hydroxytetrahydrobiopterin dehydratase